MENNIEEKIIYKDENVMISQSRYIALNKIYVMRNISSVCAYKIQKDRTMPIVLIVLGIIFLFDEKLRIPGMIILVSGAIWLFSINDKYAVRITTNSGNTDSLISKDKDYIIKIVYAINDAIIQRG